MSTKRLIIEPFSTKHLTERYASWLNDPRVVSYSEQRHNKHNLNTCKKYYNSFRNSPHYFWAISVKDKSIGHIGNITAYIDESYKIADFGILIGETKAWNKGYATEALEAVIDFLFRKLGVKKITAGTLANNKAMLRLMEKLKMVSEKRKKQYKIWQGKRINIVRKAISRKKYILQRDKQ